MDNGAKILDYILEYYKASKTQPVLFTECYKGNKKEFKLTKLTPSQHYTFRLAAVNECGQRYSSHPSSGIYNHGIDSETRLLPNFGYTCSC